MVFNTCCKSQMKGYPDGYFDLAVVDPPYGINATKMQMGHAPHRSKLDGYGSGPSVSTAMRVKNQRLNYGQGKLKNRILNTSHIDWDDNIPDQEYFKELFRISKNQIIWGGNYFPLPPTRCIIVWDKMQPWENFSQVEIAWTSFDRPAKIFKHSNTGGAHAEPKIHPTQKPVKLYEFIYHHFSKPGMKVIDTHLGSGTNRVAALKYGIEFIGIEKDLKHFQDHQEYWQAQRPKIIQQQSQYKLL